MQGNQGTITPFLYQKSLSRSPKTLKLIFMTTFFMTKYDALMSYRTVRTLRISKGPLFSYTLNRTPIMATKYDGATQCLPKYLVSVLLISLRCRRPLSIDWVLQASAQIHRISCSIKYVKSAHKELLCKLFSLIIYILASHISCRMRYVIF